MALSDNKEILRARWHDYHAPGFYLVTMVTDRREAVLGVLKGDSEATAHVELSELGRILEQEILSQKERHKEIDIETYVIMPDHCHLFIHVNEEMEEHLGKVVWGMKYGTTAAYLNALNARYGGIHKVEGSRLSKQERSRLSDGIVGSSDGVRLSDGIFGSSDEVGLSDGIVGCGVSASNVAVTVGAGDGSTAFNTATITTQNSLAEPAVTFVNPLWAKGYNDRIVTQFGQITKQKIYIQRNVARLWKKRHSDRTVTAVRDIRVPLTLSLAQRQKDAAVYWDERRSVQHSQNSQRHDGAHYAESYVELTQKFLRYDAKKQEPFLSLRVCGNADILFSGRPLVRVRVSRSVTREQFREEVNCILDRCENEGAIAVSPFLSWSEKAVLQVLRMNGYDHAIVYGEGMWDGWKPQDGSSAMHHQTLPAWFMEDYGELLSTDCSGDIAEVYAGRCAFLAPWYDRPRSTKPGKADCEIMNELCRTLEQFYDTE